MKHPVKFFSIDGRINVILIERSGGHGVLIVEAGELSWSCHFDSLHGSLHEHLKGMNEQQIAAMLIDQRSRRKLAKELQKLTAIVRKVIETLNLIPS